MGVRFEVNQGAASSAGFAAGSQLSRPGAAA